MKTGYGEAKMLLHVFPELVSFCFFFLLQAESGAVIDVLADDMYPATGSVVYMCIFSVCMTTACMHVMSLLRFSTALKMCRS